jgi:hypothetical protein
VGLSISNETLNLAYHGARALDQSVNITLQRDFTQKIALSLVADGNFHSVIEIAHPHVERRLERNHGLGPLAVPHRIRAIANQVLQNAGDVLRRQIKDKLQRLHDTIAARGDPTSVSILVVDDEADVPY